MSSHDHHLSRRDAERLLDQPAATSSALATALAAAGAPARTAELGREDATVAAFHTARLTPSPTTRSSYVSPSKLGSRAAARAVIATGAVVALTSGGFALANSAHLPTLPGQASDQATESVAKTPKPTETPTETTTETPAETPTETPTETESETALPTPSFTGLCTAFQAADHSAHGASLDSAAFTALATEAGGAEQIATYCVALIGEPKETGKPSELPTPTAKPTPGKPTDQPTGKPSVLPTPTDKPTPTTGKPTDKPAPVKGGGKSSTTSGS
jgi:hypothetical protein